jgi:2-methylcitrate dehydratase PrpD
MVRTVRFFVLLLAVFVVFAFAEESKKEKAKDKDSAPKPIEVLSAYVKVAQFKDFPGDVVNRAKYLILDNIGCALGGTQTEIGKKYLRVSANWKGAPESTVIGAGTRVSCMNAAYVNAQLANVLDFDDTYDLYSPGHPMTEEELKAKFRANTIDIFSEDQVTRIIDTVLNLEKLPKVSDLTKLLSSPQVTIEKGKK